MEKLRDDKQRKEKARKAFIIALGVSAVGGAAYLTWDHFRKKKNMQQQLPENASDTIINITNTLPATSSSKSASATDAFPLKQGSRGTRVTLLQQALDSILGEGTMKKSYGGIDGIFGPLTAAALRKAGFSEVIDEKIFNAITQGAIPSNAEVNNPSEIALLLYRAARNKNLFNVLTTLKQIQAVEDYTAANENYKKYGLISKTIVTDLLDFAFKDDESAKETIRKEFQRMGLKQSSSGIWSLSGFSDIVTIRDTFVTDQLFNRIPVKRNTILGDEIRTANGMTWFRSIDNSTLQVPTQDVKYAN